MKRWQMLAATLTLALAAGCATVSAPWSRESAIADMVSTASSAKDHEALAARYEKEASAARVDAARHLTMAESYRKMGGATVAKWHLDRHCVSIAKRYHQLAEEYEALAKGHRGMVRDETVP